MGEIGIMNFKQAFCVFGCSVAVLIIDNINTDMNWEPFLTAAIVIFALGKE